jgi:hypothetical protein
MRTARNMLWFDSLGEKELRVVKIHGIVSFGV